MGRTGWAGIRKSEFLAKGEPRKSTMRERESERGRERESERERERERGREGGRSKEMDIRER